MENEISLLNIDGQVLAEDAEAILSQVTGGTDAGTLILGTTTLLGTGVGTIVGGVIGHKNKSVGTGGGATIGGAGVGIKEIITKANDLRQRGRVAPVVISELELGR